MVRKESILNLLDVEIDKMSLSYEEKIAVLQREVDALENKNKILIAENKKLQTNQPINPLVESSQNKYESLIKYISKLNDGIPHDLINHLCESTSPNDPLLLLEIFLESINDESFETALYILEQLNNDHNSILYSEKKSNELIENILSKVFLNEIIDMDEKYDEIIKSSLRLMLKLNDSVKKDIVSEYLKKHFYDMLDIILYTNNISIITSLMRVCIVYNLRTELFEAYHHILEVEWDFLDSSISKEDFVFLLWYAYLVNLDEKLLEKASDSLKWFQESSNELILYFYLYDCLNKTTIPNMVAFQLRKNRLLDGHVLTDTEKNQVIAKIESVILPLIPKKPDQLNSTSFKWPETKLREVRTVEQEESNLNENSALRLMGYQITGLTRENRWEILKKAVPSLGLRKVATIIAYNVKLRKGQKNGQVKYRNAITEWEHDLTKLKHNYYRKNFKWPIT